MGFEYTVNSNDKGLSYIFLDQAKKLEGFDENKKNRLESSYECF